MAVFLTDVLETLPKLHSRETDKKLQMELHKRLPRTMPPLVASSFGHRHGAVMKTIIEVEEVGENKELLESMRAGLESRC